VEQDNGRIWTRRWSLCVWADIQLWNWWICPWKWFHGMLVFILGHWIISLQSSLAVLIYIMDHTVHLWQIQWKSKRINQQLNLVYSKNTAAYIVICALCMYVSVFVQIQHVLVENIIWGTASTHPLYLCMHSCMPALVIWVVGMCNASAYYKVWVVFILQFFSKYVWGTISFMPCVRRWLKQSGSSKNIISCVPGCAVF